jgi:hypothetical protein
MIVYDTEIVKCIPERGAVAEPTLQYCAGWDDHAHMGISVVCAYDLRDRTPHVYCADNLAAFAELIRGRTVIGFNNRSFDDRLLAANGIVVERSWDLCRAMRAAVGEPEEYVKGVTRAGRRLEDICRVNLGIGKSLSGERAPVEWQRGRIGVVIDYCLRDVMLLVRLLQRLPVLIDPATGLAVTIALPRERPAEASA